MNTGKTKKWLLLAGDVAVLYLALFLTIYARYQENWQSQWETHLLPFSIIYFCFLLCFYIIGLYDLTLARNNLHFFVTLIRAVLINAAIAVGFFYFIPYFGIAPKTNLFINLAVSTTLFVLWRQSYNRFVKSESFLNNVLVLGRNRETEELISYVKTNPQLGYRIKKVADIKDVKILSDLTELLTQEKIRVVVMTVNPHKDSNLVKNLYQCIPLKIVVADLPAFYEKITGKIPVSAIEEVWFLENLMSNQKNLFESTKRLVDLIIAILLGALSLMLTPFIALAIKLNGPGPVFYTQKRVGQDNRIFELIKFRTMVNDAEKNGAQWAEEKDKRITKVGRFLRRTRLDEIPQIWNIIKGDMSFVGPRPERPEFAFSNDLLGHIPFYQIRHSIKPGLTGWAQIKYPYGASVKDTMQKLQYDLYYIKNRSFILDSAIILKTIKTILSVEGR